MNIASLSIESDPQKRSCPWKIHQDGPRLQKHLRIWRAQEPKENLILRTSWTLGIGTHGVRIYAHPSIRPTVCVPRYSLSLSLPFICRPLMFLFFCNLFSLSLSPCIVFLFPSKFSLMSLSMSYVFPFIFSLLSLSLSLSYDTHAQSISVVANTHFLPSWFLSIPLYLSRNS